MRCYKRVENGKNGVTLDLNECLHLHIGKDPIVVCVSLQKCETESSSRCAYINNVIRKQRWDASDCENTLEGGNYCFGVL
jgi:hypothetical protein